MAPEPYIPVSRSLMRYATGQYPAIIDIEGACFVSIEISAGEILIDNAETLKPTVAGGVTYNGYRGNMIPFPYLFNGSITINEVTAATIVVNIWKPLNVK